uniref:non-specific serine/threonine protein kinase n=1 Tax=Pseudonaja textilis TaxID=8673 RepID=A0A670YQE4_PSETE
MASGAPGPSSSSSEADEERRAAALQKLVVRLRNLQEGKQLESLLQTLQDLLALAGLPSARLFRDGSVYVPLLLVLVSYLRVGRVQQVGWTLLCKLIKICPEALHHLTAPQGIGKDWEVLGVHQQILKMLKTHSADVHLSKVGLKALNLLLSSDEITLLLLEEGTDIFLLIFDAMDTFPDHEKIQRYGCKALHMLLEKVPEEQLIEFVEENDHLIILKVLKKFPEKENVIGFALRSLYILAGPETCFENSFQLGWGGNLHHESLPTLCQVTFWFTRRLQYILFFKSPTENFFNILVLNSVHKVIVTAVETYPENEKLQAAGLSCLALLTETIFLNRDLEEKKEEEGEKEEEEEEKLYWLEACYKALKYHRRNRDIQEAACWALNNLLMYQPTLNEKIGDEDKKYPAHREMMLAMLMYYSSSKEVFQAAANALATLAKQNAHSREILLAKGIHMNVLEIMRKHSDSPEIAESACRLLNCAFEGRDRSTSLKLRPLWLRARFYHHVGSEDTNQKTMLTLMKSQFLLEGGHSLVLGALNTFIGNPGIQKCGLQILSTITERPTLLQMLSNLGMADTLLHTLQMYPDDQEIQRLGLNFLGSLVSKKILCSATFYALVSPLVSTLRRFKDVVEIQIQGFQMIVTILQSSPWFAKLLIQESFEICLFYQLSMCFNEQRDQQFRSLCFKCFAKITEHDDLKNLLLEKACEECNTFMAECLLLLGADVNTSSKEKSLIYDVCEKGSNPKVVELLLNSGAREQDVRSALAVSMKKGDSKIISLLLKKLCLDMTNRSICLGGFGIGRMEPSWLIPLFPSRLPSSQNSALAVMVLRYQRTSSYEDQSRGDVNSQNDEMQNEWTFLPDPLVDNVFSLTDDIDSEGSESSFTVRQKSYSVAAADLQKPLQSSTPPLQRHSKSVVRPIVPMASSCTSSTSVFQPNMKSSDSFPSLVSDREYIKSLDLSSNELENIDNISQSLGLITHFEHLDKLELHHNQLSCVPKQLCETMKSLTYLDLHSNHLKSFPQYLLEMPQIVHLDVSRNEIGPTLCFSPTITCPTLKLLNLSYNQLLGIPRYLGNILINLEHFILEGNRLSTLIARSSLKELKNLNISKNDISYLDTEFLHDCLKLEKLNAAANRICEYVVLEGAVLGMELQGLTFHLIAIVFLSLFASLRSVDLSSNRIGMLPGPAFWKSSNLRELLFNHNQISILDLNDKASSWSRLEKLHLSNNKLREIPPEIGFLKNLTSFDVSYNPAIRCFPDEMGKLLNIWDLPLEGLHLNLDFKHVGDKARDIIRFLQQRLKKAVPYHRMKLMVVGNASSGKTTLLQQLMKCKRPDLGPQKPTIGIDVNDWKIPRKGKIKKETVLNVWDFAGIFLAPARNKGKIHSSEFRRTTRASFSPVILIGTHLDVANEKQRRACISKITQELMNQKGFPKIHDYHFVNATEESESMTKLRQIIIKECLDFKIRDQPVIGQLIPDSYLELEKSILEIRKTLPAEFPVIGQDQLYELVQEKQLQLDENELSHAVHFLNESGVLLHFQDPALQLRNLYFVDPKWLCKIIAQILTVKVDGFTKYPKGIIKRSDVEKSLLKNIKFPEICKCQYFKLLEKFQIALPLGEDQLLIPSSLSDQRPVIELPHCENSELIIRLYEMPYFPMGFWSRLINRLLEVSSYMLSGRERALRPNKMYWRQGIYMNWSPEAYTLVESAVLENNLNSFLKITVPSCRKGCIILGQVVDHIDSLMEEWFPGLLEVDICGEGETLLKKWALYSFEDGEEHRKILLDDLLRKAEEGDLLINPDQPKSTVPIAQIAPDLILADLPRNIMLNNDELEFHQAPENLLGDGGFGSVYRAVYIGEEVAVKVFNKHTSLRLLRQELTVLCHLHHPSLVFLMAASVRPRMLVMELAPKGSLDQLLQQENAGLTRTLQHRIALHVADGLRYLHSSMIIYRDLKPHNVLLFTLYPNSAVIAKIADYGISQYCCRMGIKTSEGTPGFRAPEVARGNVIYNQQADVYSFGLLLYDILTAGGRILEGIKFPNEFDELAIHGKLPDPVKEYGCAPWPRFEDLIKKCLKENPQERPTSDQVYEMLNSAELVCFLRHIPVPSPFASECMVATNQSSKKCGIWIGSGSRGEAQLSFVDINTDERTCEDVEDGRILCLALVTFSAEKENWVIAGTQSGSLWAFHTQDGERKHRFHTMTDSITCLYCSPPSKHKYNVFLVGTANGQLAIFEDRAVKGQCATPLKVILVGSDSTPLMCLSESNYSSDRSTIWGGCGSKILSLSSDLATHKLIETKTSQLYDYCNANIISIAVDKFIYLAKKDSYFVEIWDRKTEKLCELIDCVHLLKAGVPKLSMESKQKLAYPGRVKSICLQKNTALWIGTGGGHLLLLDLSTRLPIWIIQGFCRSVRFMMTTQLGTLKNVVLVLGYRILSSVSVWDVNLSHEVQNLKKHIVMREALAEKMKHFSVD